jgi:hypothetical protein
MGVVRFDGRVRVRRCWWCGTDPPVGDPPVTVVAGGVFAGVGGGSLRARGDEKGEMSWLL